MNGALKLLHLEDSPTDQELIARQLRRDGLEFECRYAMDREVFITELEKEEPDVILSDFELPSFNGLEALKIARERTPDVPVVFVTGALGEERAVELLKEGASDYVLKDRLQRLGTAVARAREEADARLENRKAEVVLKQRQHIEQVINQFSVNFVASGDSSVGESIAQALKELGTFVRAERAYVYLLSGDRTHMSKEHEWYRESVPPGDRDDVIPIDHFEWAREILESLSPVYVNRVESLPEEAAAERRFMRDHSIESLLLVPIAPMGRIIGFLGCEGQAAEAAWNEDTMMLIHVAGDVFGNALMKLEADRKLRDERTFLQKVLDFSEVIVMMIDAEGRFLSVNHGFTKATGYTAEECIGQSMFDFIITDDWSDQAEKDLHRILHKGSLEDYETPIRTKNKGRRVVRWKADSIENDGSMHILASGIDLTDLLAAEESRIQLELKLAQTQRIESLGRIATNVAHEFNNVLMGIQPFVDVVARTAGEDKRLKMCADHMKRSITRGSQITSQVLKFARTAEPVREAVRVREWLERIIEDIAVSTDGVKISLDVKQESTVAIDRSQMEQVIVNLLLNARDAMGGEGRVEIEVPATAPDDRYNFGVVVNPERYARIGVRDYGGGISKENLERIFEPFFTTKSKGTGLGLAVSHQIVYKHDGHMFVESREGEGTTFHVFLPKAEFAEE